ncbi:hypothetical protein SDC9_153085 [bioreactor metagenome]|uniref:Uncharacterized protein n=1 Tax=bioreactor metagenome TaxID=1076179 RepID=A0A645EUX3_9ZZZZ
MRKFPEGVARLLAFADKPHGDEPLRGGQRVADRDLRYFGNYLGGAARADGDRVRDVALAFAQFAHAFDYERAETVRAVGIGVFFERAQYFKEHERHAFAFAHEV